MEWSNGFRNALTYRDLVGCWVRIKTKAWNSFPKGYVCGPCYIQGDELLATRHGGKLWITDFEGHTNHGLDDIVPEEHVEVLYEDPSSI